jgi:hypothetical protein
MSPSSKRHATVYWTGFGIIIALLIVAPLVLPEFWRRFLTEILIWGLLAMSSDILIGYTGMIKRFECDAGGHCTITDHCDRFPVLLSLILCSHCHTKGSRNRGG